MPVAAWHHVKRQALRKLVTNGRKVDVSNRHHNPRRQLFPAAAPLHTAGGFEDARDSHKLSLDCLELYSVATQFDLGIDASHAVNIAIWQNACEVSRAVDTANLRQRDKLLGCQLGAVPVTDGQPGTCDTELACIAMLYRLKRVI